MAEQSNPSLKIHIREPGDTYPLCHKQDGRRFTEDVREVTCAICRRRSIHSYSLRALWKPKSP